MSEFDFVLSNYGDFGWGISSPQIPGLIAGEESLEAITPKHLMELAESAGCDASEGYVVHLDRVAVIGDQVFRVRLRQRADIDDGLLNAQETIFNELATNSDLREATPRSDSEDHLFVICTLSDTIGSVARTLDSGASFVACIAAADGIHPVLLVPSHGARDSAPRASAKERPFDRDETFADVLEAYGLDASASTPRVFAFSN